MKLINKEQKIFIAGSRGMVGNAITKKLRFLGYVDLLCPSREELDLGNIDSVSKWFKENKPEVVIVAAAKVGGIYANNTFPANFLLENLKIQNNSPNNSYL